MDIRTQSALLSALVATALGVSMLLRPTRPRAFSLYSLFALSVGTHYFARFFGSLLSGSHSDDVLLRVTVGAELLSGAIVPSTALAFFIEFLGMRPQPSRVGRKLGLASGLFGGMVAFTPLVDNFWARFAVAAWVIGALSVSVSLLLRRMRQSESKVERGRLMYLAIGAGASLLFSALDLVSPFHERLPAVGPTVSTLFLFFLAQTLLRLRLLDLHEMLGKIASQAVLAIILAAVFATLTAWVDQNVSLFLFNTAVAALVILILLEPLRSKVEERVVAIFFRERFELVRSLHSLRTRMANVIEVSELASLLLEAFNETRRVTHASIYLLAEDRPGYRLLDYLGPQPVAFLDTAAARGLLHAASTGQKALLLENLDRRLAEMRSQSVDFKRLRDELKRIHDTRAAMTLMKAGISVPLVGNDRVIGFLNLWDERVPEAYASDEIAVVLEIAEQVATVIENSKLYEKMRERDRLAALGEMAAGLAHEIRNPLGAIKGAAQCLDPKQLPGEDGEFLEVIVEEVNRLNGVVTAFLDYARPLKQSFGPTDINEVVTRTARLIQNAIPPNIEFTLELAEKLGAVEGDAEQLKQVLINLVQNAMQAIGGAKGRIVVRTLRPDRFSDFRASNDTLELSVSDDGPGIPLEQQQHIFVPFFTTKEKGTGLGLAICQRIVENHSGSISVQSRVGEGTTFSIRMPMTPVPEITSEIPVPTETTLSVPSAPPEAAGTAKLSRRERKRRSSRG